MVQSLVLENEVIQWSGLLMSRPEAGFRDTPKLTGYSLEEQQLILMASFVPQRQSSNRPHSEWGGNPAQL